MLSRLVGRVLPRLIHRGGRCAFFHAGSFLAAGDQRQRPPDWVMLREQKRKKTSMDAASRNNDSNADNKNAELNSSLPQSQEEGHTGLPSVVCTGLVIERFGDRLLVLPQPPQQGQRPVLCVQRARFNGVTMVVGDIVDFRMGGTRTETRLAHIHNKDASEEDKEDGSGNTGVENDEWDGDWDEGVVIRLHERFNVLSRPAASGVPGQLKSLAANVDQMLVVVAAQPVVPLHSIDRLLVAAQEHGMRAILILNKSDEEERSAVLRQTLAHYPALGYPVLDVSAHSGAGLLELRALLQGQCSLFVGQSGVGKSSLVNALLGHDGFNTGARVRELVRSSKPQGAHTTSSSRLWHVPMHPLSPSETGDATVMNRNRNKNGGSIVDSPGIRQLDLWHMPRERVQAGFVEIDMLASRCRYRNCDHKVDAKDCAVQAGLKAGIVHPTRLEHFHLFVKF